ILRIITVPITPFDHLIPGSLVEIKIFPETLYQGFGKGILYMEASMVTVNPDFIQGKYSGIKSISFTGFQSKICSCSMMSVSNHHTIHVIYHVHQILRKWFHFTHRIFVSKSTHLTVHYDLSLIKSLLQKFPNGSIRSVQEAN